MSRLSRTIAVVMLVAMMASLLAACGGGGAPAAQPTSKPASQATAKPADQPTAAPAQPATGGDPSTRVTESLGLLMGSGDKQSALPSFHIEVKMSGPSYDSDAEAVETNNTNLEADVQGANAHVWIDNDDGTTTEGYVIGNDDYVVEDGKVQPGGLSGVGLAWAMWQMDPVVILSLAGLGAQSAGTEALGGRTADVFDVDMARADPAVLGTIQAIIGRGISNGRGKAWVDQQSGALLKTVLDYEQDLYDMFASDKNAPPVGHGAGHIEIVVTKVGQVAVSLPS